MSRPIQGIITLTVIVVFTFGLFVKFNREKVSVIPPIHYHAGFQVYQNGTLVDFSDLKYMQLESCVEGDQTEAPEDDQIEKAHLHNLVGDVVHVHRSNSLWGDLFKNLNYELDASASAYLNGQPITNLAITPIEPYDSLIIFQGQTKNTETLLAKAVTKDYIMSVESISEACGDSK